MAGWAACLVLVVVLAASGWQAASGAARQARGVRGLLQAGESMSSEELQNPFVCLREGGEAERVREALAFIDDVYLQGVGWCMAGEKEEGLANLERAERQSFADVQAAANLSVVDPEAGINLLKKAVSDEDELLSVLKKLSAQTEIEPYPALRGLAGVANDQASTWWLWIQEADNLLKAKEWQEALAWMEEGSRLVPQEYRSSIYSRIGRIYQIEADPRNYEKALEYYNRAIDSGGWLNVVDKANAHMFRGEMYRALKYEPEQALEEFQTALQMQPGYYWALMNIGHVYLYDLKEPDRALAYYQEALTSKNEVANAYYHIGDVYRMKGDNKTAIEWYRQALERKADYQAAMDRIAELEGIGK